MPRSIAWPPARIAQFRTLASVPGTSWDTIAIQMGLSRNCIIDAARKFGIKRALAAVVVPHEPRAREGFPAGHPVTWGLITAGTCLEGEDWPGR